ncbi:hypothetical protein C7M52_01428 [Mixta theicola]|nr:hypothetical protein C7M52_01428 [Mixta theicola]
MTIVIKPATRQMFAALRAIELASFTTLRAAGAVTGRATASSAEDLQRYLAAGLLWAALTPEALPVGFLGAYQQQGWLHIAEMDVDPVWQRQGIGRGLMAQAIKEGRARKLRGVTLTTDRFAPFNAPFYAALGLHIVARDECPERLKAILAAESAAGFDARRRVAMMMLF